ncbi:hypothetical protein Micbo1qcDRAFT_168475 [Microdochium bolleyi]|uniref:Uncharacterized protein n=1 Tax=Microdochium bolleyi TaxID=196109 RepID=A0A136IP31_9PEZI|nr:hypothetical protein Micbo1qcDRAFT_168475 [Microdochium bolleyi]
MPCSLATASTASTTTPTSAVLIGTLCAPGHSTSLLPSAAQYSSYSSRCRCSPSSSSPCTCTVGKARMCFPVATSLRSSAT